MASDRFEPLDPGVWRAKAETALGPGMAQPDGDGIPIQALYAQEDRPAVDDPGTGNRVRGNRAGPTGDGWEIRHEYGELDPSRLARAISIDRGRGMKAAWIRLDPRIQRGGDPGEGTAAHQGGAMLDNLAAFGDGLGEASRSSVPIYLEAGAAGPAILAFWLALANERGVPPANLSGGVLCDPVSTLAMCGDVAQPFELAYITMADVASVAKRRAPQLASVGVSTRVWHDAGASPAFELGLGVATALEYLRALERYGVSPGEATARMIFNVSVGPTPLPAIAKLRALRMLWAGVVSRAGLDPTFHGARLHVRGSHRHLARRDPWMNMLRGTVTAFAGACAGAEGIAVPAFDEAPGPSDDFGRRMALNTQVILRDEAHLHRVLDPAGGSYYVEDQTRALARKAWEHVVGLEQQGGVVAGLRSGSVQKEIRTQAARTRARLESGEQVITGVTLHPPQSDRPTGVRSVTREAAVLAAEYRQPVSAGASRNRDRSLQALAARLNDGGPADRIDAAVSAASAGASVEEIVEALTGGGARIVIRPLRFSRLAGPCEEEPA